MDLARPYVQVQGTAKVTPDPDEEQACCFDLLGDVFTGPDDLKYGCIIVTPYRAEYIQPGAMVPDVWEK